MKETFIKISFKKFLHFFEGIYMNIRNNSPTLRENYYRTVVKIDKFLHTISIILPSLFSISRIYIFSFFFFFLSLFFSNPQLYRSR